MKLSKEVGMSKSLGNGHIIFGYLFCLCLYVSVSGSHSRCCLSVSPARNIPTTYHCCRDSCTCFLTLLYLVSSWIQQTWPCSLVTDGCSHPSFFCPSQHRTRYYKLMTGISEDRDRGTTIQNTVLKLCRDTASVHKYEECIVCKTRYLRSGAHMSVIVYNPCYI